MTVVFAPAMVGIAWLVEPGDPLIARRRGRERHCRSDEHHARYARWMLGGQQEAALRAQGEANDDRAVTTGGIEHGHGIGRELPLVICVRTYRAVRASVATRVERDDPVMACEVGNLHLPAPRVHDRPRRQEQNRCLAVAIHLVEDLDAVPFDESICVRVACPALFRAHLPASRATSQSSTQRSSSRWPSEMPDRRSSSRPWLKVITRLT